MVWVIYTASIDAETQQAAAGWGSVVISPAQEERIAQGVINFKDDKTYRAGLMALVRALLFVPVGERVEIVSNDQQIANGVCFRKNIPETNKDEDILSAAYLWQQVYALIDAREVNMGGVGENWNKVAMERARALAQEALDAYASGQMPTSTPTITDYELAGSPGSEVVGVKGCLAIIIMSVIAMLVVGFVSTLVKGVWR